MRRTLPLDIQVPDRFAELPKEIIIEIALSEPIDNITRLCQSSVRFNNVICNNNNFWFQKFIRDFGESRPGFDVWLMKETNVLSWKDAYKNQGRAIAFGNDQYGQLGLGGGLQNKNVKFPIPNIRIKSVSCGGFHTALIDLNNDVWVCGANGYGQLGLGHAQSLLIPTPLNIKAKFVVCGGNNTMLIDLNNNLWGFGRNDYSQLGLGDNIHRNIPVLISEKIGFVACSDFHTIIINSNFEVWVCGRNDHGQLGLGHNENRNIPHPLLVLSQTGQINVKAKRVACGAFYTMLISGGDTLWAFGANGYGQLGLGDNVDKNIPTPISDKVKSVTCGHSHTIITNFDDKIGVCGHNQYGQLGLGNNSNANKFKTISNIKSKNIYCGDNHTIMIDLNKNVWVCGYNSSGQLGLGDYLNRNILTQIPNTKCKFASAGESHTIMIRSISQVDDNFHLMSFDDAEKKLNAGEFLGFNIEPIVQYIPHNPINVIGTFRGRGSKDIYYVELQYDPVTNQIFPPK